MTDLKIPEIDSFTQQAKVHYQVRDGLNELISDFDRHHQIILSQLDSSQVEHYLTWWQNFKAYLANQAVLHDQLGQHLTTAGQNYYKLDQDITKAM
jgi:hypothetical protein